MKFTKMHGCGNDYIYIDCFKEGQIDDAPALARRLSHRHFGVGGDGLILIKPAEADTDVTMEMYNADGSMAEMCGNGLRCLVKFVFDHGIVPKEQMVVMTGAGPLAATASVVKNGKVEEVSLEMGYPIFDATAIPTTWTDEQVVARVIEIEGTRFEVTCLSMGNPHCVIYVDDVEQFPVARFGPLIENASFFPARINVEFVQVLSKTHVKQRTWERGSGETWACGTGASAVCVAGVMTGKSDRQLQVDLLGGMLRLHYRADGMVVLKGPAEEVFTGELADFLE